MAVGTQDVTLWNEEKNYSVEVTSDNRLKVDSSVSNPRSGQFFSLHLKNGSNYSLNVDGSVTPVSFTLSPSAGKKYFVYRMILMIEDTSMNFLKFGGISGGLTNGLEFKVTESGIERSLFEHPIKFNSDFLKIAYDVKINSAATDVLSCRWTFAKAGTVLELKNSTSDEFKAIVNDDLTTLNKFEIILQGYDVNE